MRNPLQTPAALVYLTGTVLERYEYDAYGNPTIWNADFTTERDNSNYGNPYLFTGRRVDILDSSSLKIQYNRNRYYDYYTGRWLTHDPLDFVDGMNLYKYVGSNPTLLIDPFGLWKVNRAGSAKAEAEAECGDTIRKLADEIGLEADQWSDWVTIDGTISTIGGEALTADSPICAGEVKIPNTVIAHWAGELGIFGRIWVWWGRDMTTLRRRGFYVAESKRLTAAGFEDLITNGTANKELHGMFFWGHGFHGGWTAPWNPLDPFNLSRPHKPWKGVITDSRKKKKAAYKSSYSRWKSEYKLALGILFACGTDTVKPGNGTYEIFSDDAIFWGAPNILIPLGTPSAASIIPAGAQRTRE